MQSEPQEKLDLYDWELESFSRLLKEDPPKAYEKFGLTLFYSLENDEFLQEQSRFRKLERDVLDYYNRGVLSSQEGKYKEALRYYQRAEKLLEDKKDSRYSSPASLPELFFNIGLTYLHIKDKANGKKYLNQYIKIVEDIRKKHRELYPDWEKELKEIEELLKVS